MGTPGPVDRAGVDPRDVVTNHGMNSQKRLQPASPSKIPSKFLGGTGRYRTALDGLAIGDFPGQTVHAPALGGGILVDESRCGPLAEPGFSLVLVSP